MASAAAGASAPRPQRSARKHHLTHHLTHPTHARAPQRISPRRALRNASRPQQGRVYIAITSKAYPSRYIYSSTDGSTRGVLGALKREIIEKFPDASLTCAANGLDAKVKPLLKALCDEFNDVKQIDKIASVQSKVDAVTGVMQKNIELALKNTDRLEDIDEKAVVLADSAQKFKNAGTALKRKMQCRYWKMILFFGVLSECRGGGARSEGRGRRAGGRAPQSLGSPAAAAQLLRLSSPSHAQRPRFTTLRPLPRRAVAVILASIIAYYVNKKQQEDAAAGK